MDEVMDSASASLDTRSCLSSFDELDSSIPLRSFRLLMLDRTGCIQARRADIPGQFAKKRLEHVSGVCRTATHPRVP